MRNRWSGRSFLQSSQSAGMRSLKQGGIWKSDRKSLHLKRRGYLRTLHRMAVPVPRVGSGPFWIDSELFQLLEIDLDPEARAGGNDQLAVENLERVLKDVAFEELGAV
jgi:hypothetical protein